LQVAWEAFNENYAFFEARGVKWRDQYDKARVRLKTEMSEEELFRVISDMLASLGDDGHVSLRGPGKQSFSGARIKPHPIRAHAEQWREMVRRKYLNNTAERMANDKIVTGRLPDGTFYLELFRVAGFSETGTADKEIAAFNEALDRIFKRLKPGEPLVLDLRFNAGGYDDYSLLIAGRLTSEPSVAFLKQPRIQGTNEFGPLHVRHVFPSPGPPVLGRIILLTSGMTYSGAEILTMATMRFANVTRVGEPTAGALSDVLPFKLPNGWEIGLSNERYFASDGVVYEDRGVPPHLEAPMSKQSLDQNIDPGLETAMRLLQRRTN
ncbi:MAG TPA: S41 family peptidase, partial [Pyrinomonadaceae bacterium]